MCSNSSDPSMMMEETVVPQIIQNHEQSLADLTLEEVQSPPYEESMYINSPEYTAISVTSPTTATNQNNLFSPTSPVNMMLQTTSLALLQSASDNFQSNSRYESSSQYGTSTMEESDESTQKLEILIS